MIRGILLGCVPSVKTMESLSSSRHPKRPQQEQHITMKNVASASVKAPREGDRDDGRRLPHGGVPAKTVASVLRTNTEIQASAAKPKQGSFGGKGSARQRPSYSPHLPSIPPGAAEPPSFIFGTGDFSVDTPMGTNSQVDFPQLPNNVDNAQASTGQPETQVPVSDDDQGKDVSSGGSLESEGPPPLDLKDPPPLDLKGASVQIAESQKRPERDLGSERPTSQWKVQSSDSIPNSQSPLIDDSQFPSLIASSAVARGKSSRKGVRDLAEQGRTAHGHLPSRSQVPTQRTKEESVASVSGGGADNKGYANIVQNRQRGYNDGRKGLGWQGESRDAPLSGKWREAQSGGEWRNGRQDSERWDSRSAGESKNGRQGSARRDDQQRDPAWEKQNTIEALGRLLTRILRHQALDLDLKMGSDGFVDVQDLLKLSMKTRANRKLSSHSIDDVRQAVEQDNKQRIGIKEDNGKLLIRANQGHTIESVEAEHLLSLIVSAKDVPECVHGTYSRHLDAIFKEGLKCMGRNHVHFATGKFGDDRVISGMRSDADVVIYLNVEKALADGMKLYISVNGVILTEGFGGVVPPDYFAKVLGLPEMKPITSPSVPS